MAITTMQFHIVGGAARVKVFTAASPGWLSIASNASQVFLGNNGVTLANGFKIGQETITLKLDGGDEIWAISTTDTILYLMGQPD